MYVNHSFGAEFPNFRCRSMLNTAFCITRWGIIFYFYKRVLSRFTRGVSICLHVCVSFDSSGPRDTNIRLWTSPSLVKKWLVAFWAQTIEFNQHSDPDTADFIKKKILKISLILVRSRAPFKWRHLVKPDCTKYQIVDWMQQKRKRKYTVFCSQCWVCR